MNEVKNNLDLHWYLIVCTGTEYENNLDYVPCPVLCVSATTEDKVKVKDMYAHHTCSDVYIIALASDTGAT